MSTRTRPPRSPDAESSCREHFEVAGLGDRLVGRRRHVVEGSPKLAAPEGEPLGELIARMGMAMGEGASQIFQIALRRPPIRSADPDLLFCKNPLTPTL